MRQRQCLFAATLAVGFSATVFGQVTSSWLVASDGAWGNPSNWSSNPIAPVSGDYRAVVAATGNPYKISIDSDVSIRSVSIPSSGATVVQTGLFTASEYLDVGNGLWQVGTFVSSGAIRNTSILASGAGRLRCSSFVPASLDHVQCSAPIDVEDEFNSSASLYVLNNLTLNQSTLTLQSKFLNNVTLISYGTQTIDGTGQIILRGALVRFQTMADQLTLGSGIHLRGDGTLGSSLSEVPVNKGTISADSSWGGMLHIKSALRNEGTLQARNGGNLVLTVSPSFNTGTILLDSQSTLTLMGNVTPSILGNFQRSGGTVSIGGALVNHGRTTYLNEFSGGWTAGGMSSNSNAVLQGGTIASAGGVDTLRMTNNVVLTQGIRLDCNAWIRVSRTLFMSDAVQLNGQLSLQQYATLSLAGNTALSGNGTIVLGDASADPATSTISLQGSVASNGVTIRTGSDCAQFTGSGTLTNQGVISSSGLARGINFSSSTSLINQGMLAALSGATFSLAGTWNNSGNVAISQTSIGVMRNAWINTGTITINGAVVHDYTGTSSLPTIQAQIATGFAGGAWTGPGINSSLAAGDPARLTVIALPSTQMFTAFPAVFRGVSVDSTAILILTALRGDCNLDGRTNTLDFNLLAANFGGTEKSWPQGDFSNDSIVDSTDFGILVSCYGRSLPAPAASLGSAVPEPLSVAILLPVLGWIAVRREKAKNP